MTANFSVERAVVIQGKVGIEGFRKLDLNRLGRELRRMGHRFPEQRAERIALAREKIKQIASRVAVIPSGKELRDMLISDRSELRVKGFGMKEASHFLRNIGFEDVAIIDRHLYRFLRESGVAEDMKTLTRRRYLLLEEALEKLAGRVGVSIAELDLLIFYGMTGTILK